VIRPLNDDFTPDNGAQPAAATKAAVRDPERTPVWTLDDLPPELEYFRTSEAYAIELTGFQGPLDLLLYLIQKDEIDIYDIPIARITDQFIQHIDIMRTVSLDRANWCAVYSSTNVSRRRQPAYAAAQRIADVTSCVRHATLSSIS